MTTSSPHILPTATLEQLPKAITEHPMWETQVRLEYGMRQYGLDHSEAARDKYEDRGQMTRMRPVRSLVAELLPKVTKQLVEWLDACSRSRGVTPVAASYLRARPERENAKAVNEMSPIQDNRYPNVNIDCRNGLGHSGTSE